MSGLQGLLGFDGCCCDPCGEDVDNFEFDLDSDNFPTAAIDLITWIEKFQIGVVSMYINYITPYEMATTCDYLVETDNDCCILDGDGFGLKNVCCPYTCFACGGTHFPIDCCFSTLECCIACQFYDPAFTACGTGGSVSGNYIAPEYAQNLNVDGDGFPIMCCDCALGCLSALVHPSPGGCGSERGSNTICTNVQQDEPLNFSGFATYGGGGTVNNGGYQLRIPCDNSTENPTTQGAIYGYWTHSVGDVVATLHWLLGNVDYEDEKGTTICNTLMFRLKAKVDDCESASEQFGSAFWGKKFAPTSNLKLAGDFTIGKVYKIKVIGTTDFTLIGAPSNTVSMPFVATGVGTGNGKAYEARTGEVIALAYEGIYELRCVQTEDAVENEFDGGDTEWFGIERSTAIDSELGTCSCTPNPDVPANNTCTGEVIEGSCGDAISATYPTCFNAMTDTVGNISNLRTPLPRISLSFFS